MEADHASDAGGVLPLPFRAPLSTASAKEIPKDHDEKMRPRLQRIMVAAQILELSVEARFAAAVLLHRFYVAIALFGDEKDKDADHGYVSGACLFLACKASEENRRLRDIINLIHMVLDEALGEAQTGRDSSNENASPARANNTPSLISTTGVEDTIASRKVPNVPMKRKPPPLDDAYWESKADLVDAEQMVLRWLGFDTSVPSPHRLIHLLLSHLDEESKKNQLMASTFERLDLDVVFSSDLLCRSSIELAAAGIELAQDEVCEAADSSRLFEPNWWQEYDVATHGLELTKLYFRRSLLLRGSKGHRDRGEPE